MADHTQIATDSLVHLGSWPRLRVAYVLDFCGGPPVRGWRCFGHGIHGWARNQADAYQDWLEKLKHRTEWWVRQDQEFTSFSVVDACDRRPGHG